MPHGFCRRRPRKPSWPLRGAAVFGFAMTLLNAVTSIVPIIDVQNRTVFALKVGGVTTALNIAGAIFYWRADSARAGDLSRSQARNEAMENIPS